MPGRLQDRRERRALAMLSFAALTCSFVVGAAPAPATTSSYAGPCRDADALTGVTVVVDPGGLAPVDGADAVQTRCAPPRLDERGEVVPRTGLEALRDAGFSAAGTTRFGDAVVCRIDGRPAADEALPVESDPGYLEACTESPPPAAFWSAWHADGSGEDWQFTGDGATAREVIPGGFEGWSFALNAEAELPAPSVEPVNDAVDPAAPRIQLTRSPQAETVSRGTDITLTWEGDNLDELIAEGAWSGDLTIPSGSRTVRLEDEGVQEFRVRGTAADGRVAIGSVSVRVEADGPNEPEEPVPGGPGMTPQGIRIDPAARVVSGWLVGELESWGMPAPMPTELQPIDWGLTIDTLWALYAAGTGERAVRRMIAAIDRNAGDYLGIKLFRDDGVRRGGQTAKLLVAAVVAGRDPRSFGRRMGSDGRLRPGRYDMRQETLDLVVPSGPQKGRIRDRGLGIDNTNVFSQSLAVLGLARSGGVPVAAVDYLLRQQCSAGYFRMFDRNDRTCDQDRDASDGDGTAMGVQALMTARAAGVSGLGDEIERGIDWLLEVQRPDGSFGGGVTTESSNTNSTGLIAQTLGAAGEKKAYQRAKAYVRSLTVVDDRVTGALRGERGAIAYNREALADGTGQGILGRDQWRRATAQAIFALAPVSFVDLGRIEPEGDPDVNPPPTEEPATEEPPAPAPPPDAPRDLPLVPGDAGVVPASGTPAARVAAYLAGRLVDGDHLEVRAGGRRYVDYDLTADLALALRLTGHETEVADRVTRFLLDERSVEAYAHGEGYEEDRAAYAEPLAKLVLVGLTAPASAHHAVADDLSAALAALADDDGFTDQGDHADGSGSLARLAWATLAMTAVGEHEVVEPAVAPLTQSLCTDGTAPAVPEGDCASGDLATTALVTAALNAAPARGDAGPADAPVNRPPEDWPADRSAALAAMGDALQSSVALSGLPLGPAVGTAGGPRLQTLAVLADGRRSLGLDVTPTRRVALSEMLRDGGLPVAIGRDGSRRSDLETTISAAGTIAGHSLLTAPGSPLSAQLQLPILVPGAPSTPTVAGDDRAREPDGSPVPWIAAAAAAVLLAYSLGRLGRPNPSTHPRKKQ